VEPEKCIQALQEEIVRKNERLQHYEKDLLHAKSLEAEFTAARQKNMEQAVVIRKMELEIAALVKVGSEREEEMAQKNRQLRLYEEQLKKSGVDLKVKKMEAKVQDVFKFLRNKERDFYDLQSQVAMKKQEIEQQGAELKMAAHYLTQCKEENIQLNTKIQALEYQLQYSSTKKCEVERNKQPLSCTTQMLKQNDIRHSNLDFQEKSQHNATCDNAVLMEYSIINDTTAPPANHLLTNHIKNQTHFVRTTEDDCTDMDWQPTTELHDITLEKEILVKLSISNINDTSARRAPPAIPLTRKHMR
jgi:chromosome segregation ATPase